MWMKIEKGTVDTPPAFRHGECQKKNAPDRSQEHYYFFCEVPCFSALQPIREREPTLIWELQP